MHDKKRDLLWQTRIITKVFFCSAISVHPNCLSIIKEPFDTNEFIEFLPKDLVIAKKGETPKDYKCCIEESSAKDSTT